MTEPDNHRCAACGHPAPVEFKQPVAYNLSFAAPAGIYRDVIIAHSPEEALERAKQRNESRNPRFKPEEFEGDDNAYRIQQITVDDPDGDQLAIWTEPNYFAEKHAVEILDYLESIINAADGLAEKRRELDETISDIGGFAEDAARRIESLRVQGGAQ